MEDNTFTKENFEKLQGTCEKIISLCKENVDGSLMASQLMLLGDNITHFLQNPIVKNSGLVPSRPSIKTIFSNLDIS
jgi:hypothetical protein